MSRIFVVCAVLALVATQTHGVRIKYMSYAQIVAKLKALEQQYPDLVEVYAAQQRYPQYVPSAGSCRDGKGGHTPCLQWFIRITNESTLPDERRPEVFYSGNLHGDEDVGPMTLIYMAEFLLKTYKDGSNPWIRRLVDTRSITMLPMSNAIGYDKIVREENHVDPNRDFPYDRDPNHCMVTACARAINEVWRDHLFQLSITFHGGMQAISYEWGSPNHVAHGSESPDEVSQRMLGSAMSKYAGAFQHHTYPHNRLNPLVYPVEGGMEDWAYAASWDTSYVHQCTPSSYGGYPKSRTTYTSDMLRAFNFLVETWDMKRPYESELGDDEGMLVVEGPGDGHVPRNFRLAMLFLDVVQPYVQLTRVTSIPTRALRGLASEGRRCTDAVAEPIDRPISITVETLADDKHVDVTLKWHIGGAMHVDSTHVVYSPYDAPIKELESHFPPSDRQQPGRQAAWRALVDGGAVDASLLTTGRSQSGPTEWSQVSMPNKASTPYSTMFEDTVRLPASSGTHVLMVRTQVDSNWASEVNPSPNLPPQSHVVNARTNEGWDRQNNNHRIVGRKFWVSTPVVVRVAQAASPTDPDGSSTGSDSSGSDSSGSDASGSDASAGSDASGSDASGSDGSASSGSDASGSDASAGSDASGSDSTGSDSTGSDSTGSDASGSDASGSDSTGSDTSGSDASGSDATGSDTTGSDASGSDSTGSDASGSDASGSDASGSDASGSDASGSDASGSDASGSDASGSDSTGSDAAGSDASGSDVSGSNADASGSDSTDSGSATGADTGAIGTPSGLDSGAANENDVSATSHDYAGCGDSDDCHVDTSSLAFYAGMLVAVVAAGAVVACFVVVQRRRRNPYANLNDLASQQHIHRQGSGDIDLDAASAGRRDSFVIGESDDGASIEMGRRHAPTDGSRGDGQDSEHDRLAGELFDAADDAGSLSSRDDVDG